MMERPGARCLSRTLSILAVGLLVSACGGITRVVEIRTRTPETLGASIYVNGEKKGNTPSRVSMTFSGMPGQRVLVQVVKANYKPGFQYWTLEEVPDKPKEFQLEDE